MLLNFPRANCSWQPIMASEPAMVFGSLLNPSGTANYADDVGGYGHNVSTPLAMQFLELDRLGTSQES